MCGIAGILDREGRTLTTAALRTMCEAASHRGPDDWGMAWWTHDGQRVDGRDGQMPAEEDRFAVGLGHRRLSIIDLSPAGHQPMTDEEGRYWLVFNGEMYNYIEVRAELQSLGHRFRTRSDSEVVIAAWKQWGMEAFARFNGMWAVALYDTQDRTLILSRDRFGVKPLYYRIEKGVLLFASEIKQILALPAVPRKINHEILADFLLWRYETHTTDSFVQGIQSVPQGTVVLVKPEDLDRGRIAPRRFWEPRISDPLGEEKAKEEFRALLWDAVRLRLRSDVPVGVTLSGGLDSSSVTCLAASIRREETQDPLHTFTSVYDDRGYSEKEYSDLVNSHVGARAHDIRPESDHLREDWGRFIRTMEEPFSSLSFYSNWKVYQQIRRHDITVILSGQGGDELLLGYDRYRIAYMKILLRKGRLGSILREMRLMRTNANLSLSTQIQYLAYFLSPRMRVWRRERVTRGVLREDFRRAFLGQDEHILREYGYRTRRELQESEYYHYQLPHLLRHEDRVSMSHSIETRLPFLDYRLFEFLLSQDDSATIGGGWSKRILRQSMRQDVPTRILDRTDKMGFETPTGRLLRENRDFFADLMRRHADDPFVQGSAVAEAMTGPGLDENLLCSIITYLSWKEEFGLSA